MINLLPWREELRQKRKKEMLLAALGAVLLGAAITMGTKFFYQSLISNQEARNGLLRAEIAELNKQNEEIEGLKIQKERLLERTRVIEELEQSRPEAVTLVDALVDIIPEGIYLTAVTQRGASIEIEGIAQTNTRVSSLMRNVRDAEWLKTPRLDIVTTEGSGATRQGDFKMLVNQVLISDNEETQ
jgi:type IV pilus assembly protein PilN